MTYIAIARKWRPNRFEDLVGQEAVVQTLRNAIQYNRLAHAYLFGGPRGVGKTSVARIFAKALRCPNAVNATPCNQCEECSAISESRSVDVVEIDGASNNGVEAVRSIRENVIYSASSGKYKVYIIDEVHMLSLSAFNALLKTLEEPPEHVVFLFATTEIHKIPLTILSRCQRFEFRRLTQVQIIERLKHVIREEPFSIENEGLQLIASYSDGSLRDALSLLDQVLSHTQTTASDAATKNGESNPSVKAEDIILALGITPANSALDFLRLIIEKNTKGYLKVIHETFLSGVDLKLFSQKCLEEIRLLYLLTLARQEGVLVQSEALDISPSHFDGLKELTEKTSLIQVERMAQVLSKTISQIHWSSLPQFVLEMAAVRMAHLDGLEEVENSVLTQEPRAFLAPNPAPHPSPMQASKMSLPIENTEPKAQPQTTSPSKVTPPVTALSSTQNKNDSTEMRPPDRPAAEPQHKSASTPPAVRNWQTFVDTVMKKRPLLGALLCHADFSMDDKKQVTLRFAEGSFFERQATDPKNRTEIESQLKAFYGPGATLALSSSAGNLIQSIETSEQAQMAAAKKEALEHPAVLKAKELLGADIVDVNVHLGLKE